MRFEKLKRGRKDNKVQKLIDQFLQTGYDKVEVFNEDDYEDDAKMVAAIRWVVKNDYKDKVEISHTKGRIFMQKIKETSKSRS